MRNDEDAQNASPVRFQKNAEQWCDEGHDYGEAERYEEALFAYEQALLLDPAYVSAFLGKAYALGNLDRDEEALLVCEQALALDSNDPLLYLYKGNALAALERHGDALEAYSP
jgi:tetratricopeptide (TPR) repeat protein